MPYTPDVIFEWQERFEYKVCSWHLDYLSNPEKLQCLDERILGLTQGMEQIIQLFQSNRDDLAQNIREYFFKNYQTMLSEWYGIIRAIDSPYQVNDSQRYGSIAEQLEEKAKQNMDSSIPDRDRHLLITFSLLSYKVPAKTTLGKWYNLYNDPSQIKRTSAKGNLWNRIRKNHPGNPREVNEAIKQLRWLQSKKKMTTEDSKRYHGVLEDMHSFLPDS